MIPVTPIPVFRASTPSRVVLGATLSAPKSRVPHMTTISALFLARPRLPSPRARRFPLGRQYSRRGGGVAMASGSRFTNRLPGTPAGGAYRQERLKITENRLPLRPDPVLLQLQVVERPRPSSLGLFSLIRLAVKPTRRELPCTLPPDRADKCCRSRN